MYVLPLEFILLNVLWLQSLLQAVYKDISFCGHQRALVERVRKWNCFETDLMGLDFKTVPLRFYFLIFLHEY